MTSDPLIGRKFGNYTILRKLGAGGSASVYLADQPDMFRHVALKLFSHESNQDNPSALGRFQREVQALATLEHVHILPVYEWGNSEGYIYLAMRLADQSLAQYLRLGQLSLPEIARLLDQIASALDYAHDHQVIHRDLKPQNILLDTQKNCLLADFGIAFIMESKGTITPEGSIVGTPLYMSPEQASVKRVTVQSDIYSLGIIVYEMVGGQVPFQGTIAQVISQQLNAQPLPPRGLRPDLPEAANAAILRALDKEPAARFPTAKAFADAFKAAIAKAGDVELNPTIIGQTEVEPPSQLIPKETIDLSVKAPTLRHRYLSRRWLIGASVIVVAVLIVGGAIFVSSHQIDPAAARSYNDSGLKALQGHDDQTAINDFQAAIRADPDLAEPYYNLGVAYEERNDASQLDISSALTAYREALKHDSLLLLARYRLAELLLDQSQNEEAFTVIDTGVAILTKGDVKVDNRDALYFMLYATHARAYLQLGGTSSNFNLAMDDALTALAYKSAVPYAAEAYYVEARVDKALGKTAEASQAWLNVIATSDPANFRHRAWDEEAKEALKG